MISSSIPKSVLLLKAPSTDQPKDPYEQLLESKGYGPVSIPVVETTLTNLTELRRIIFTNPINEQFHGVIITSKRSVDAWSDVIREAENHVHGFSEANWSQIPFFAVGESTSGALKDLHKSFPSDLCPSVIIGGSETGTSERLAEYILSYYENKKGIRLLYLTGDKNRDTLPNILQNGDIDLTATKVYETRGSPRFAESLRRYLAERSMASSWWIVFFAPSTADFTLPILREHFQLSREEDGTKRQANIAAIGPTTEEHLRRELSLKVDVTALKPKPTELVSAIREYDQQLESVG